MEGEEINLDKENFITITKDSLTDYFEIIRNIGEGRYGKVYEVKNKKTLETFACKKVSKSSILNPLKFKDEISIMSKSDHPNILKLYKIYESNRSLYLIMELCKGGELFKQITKKALNKRMYTEKDAAEIFQQIMSGIEYCHNQGICHRDLKPENILYLKEGSIKDNPLKIIDFGLSKFFRMNKLSSSVGSVYYVSPEVLDHSYTEKCDIWSGGVLLFLLLSGKLPFFGNNDTEIFTKIKSFKYNMDDNVWKNISDEAKDLIKHILVPEKERYTAKEVLSHPWFRVVHNIEDKKINIDFNIFKKYSEENNLKKIILYFIATRLNEQEIQELNKIFKKLDKSMDGQISYEEFEKGIIEYQNKNNILEQIDIKHTFKEMDINKNGQIDYSEFIAASLENRKEIIGRRLLEVFSSLDKEQNGKIKKEDFIKELHIDNLLKEKEFEAIINNLAKDDLIDYKEFIKLFEG